MKNILIVLLCLSTISLASAQPAKEQEVTAAIEKLRKAMIDGDQQALDNLTSADLSYGHSSGTIEDKAAFMAAIVSGKNDFKSIDLSGISVKFSAGIAIVRHTLKGELINNGIQASLNIGVLQVWQKEKGQWKLVARQAFKW